MKFRIGVLTESYGKRNVKYPMCLINHIPSHHSSDSKLICMSSPASSVPFQHQGRNGELALCVLQYKMWSPTFTLIRIERGVTKFKLSTPVPRM